MKKAAFSISLLLVLNLLLSCTQDSQSGVIPTGSESTTREAASEQPSEVPPPEIDAVDYGGEEFIFLVTETDGINYLLNEIVSDEITGEVINDAIYHRNSILEEKYNISIKTLVQGVGKFDAVKTAAMSGTDDFDAATPGICNAFAYGAAGYLVDLNTVPHLDFTREWWNQASIKDASVAGRNFFAVGDMNLLAHDSTAVLFFNKKLVEEYSLDNPYSLVLSGEWTFDKMMEMCRAVSSDVNGDGVFGKEDSYGLALNSYGSLTFTYGTNVIFAPKDSSDIPALAIDGRFTSFFQKLVNTVATDTSVLFGERYGGDRVAVMQSAFEENRLLFLNEMMNRTALLRTMETDFGILPMPKGDKAQENYTTFVHQSNSSTITVPISNQNLDMAGRILEDMAYYSYLHVRPAYIDTALKSKYLRDDESKQMLDIIIRGTRYDIALLLSASSVALLNDLRTLLTKGNDNVVSFFEGKSAAYTSGLEKSVQQITG